MSQRLIHNPRAIRAPYPAELARILSIAGAEASRSCLAGWPLLRSGPTPLWELPGAANRLGIAGLWVKDESQRSPLGSFKALGAPFALLRLIQRLRPELGRDPADLLRGAGRDELGGVTVISATDGNHGRALAAAAASLGCRCVIVLHEQVSAERERAIAAYGAEIRRIGSDYDQSVAAAAELAAAQGWHVVSDTSYAGYTDIPRDVMQGYAAIAAEALEQTASRPNAPAFTHVLLQGGVGGLAAGVASYLWEYHGRRRPRFIVVEPEQADCLAQSARAGQAARTAGAAHSIMAGLACGEASPLAWRLLERCGDDFLTIGDDAAISAVRILAAGVDADPPIVAGESGAAGLAGLIALAEDPAHAAATALGAESRVLLINTEGATDPVVYHDLVGASAAVILRQQAAWLAAR